MNGDALFSDYTYAQGDENLADPTTTTGGFNWEDFVNSVVRGTTEIIAVSRQPAPTLPYRPRTTTTGQTVPGSSNNMLILAVVIVGAVLLLK